MSDCILKKSFFGDVRILIVIDYDNVAKEPNEANNIIDTIFKAPAATIVNLHPIYQNKNSNNLQLYSLTGKKVKQADLKLLAKGLYLNLSNTKKIVKYLKNN